MNFCLFTFTFNISVIISLLTQLEQTELIIWKQSEYIKKGIIVYHLITWLSVWYLRLLHDYLCNRSSNYTIIWVIAQVRTFIPRVIPPTSLDFSARCSGNKFYWTIITAQAVLITINTAYSCPPDVHALSLKNCGRGRSPSMQSEEVSSNLHQLDEVFD